MSELDPEALAKWLEPDAFDNRRRSPRNHQAAARCRAYARKLAKKILKWHPLVAALRAPPASPTGRQLGPGKRDELPPIVSEGVGAKPMIRPDLDTYEAMARLTHLASISPGPAGDDLRSLLAYIRELEGALEPFAKLIPSSIYPGDGSEGEGYVFYLGEEGDGGNQFTGLDLARARSALSKASGEGG